MGNKAIAYFTEVSHSIWLKEYLDPPKKYLKLTTDQTCFYRLDNTIASENNGFRLLAGDEIKLDYEVAKRANMWLPIHTNVLIRYD